MKDNYDDITAHPIKGYRGEDIYNDSEKARKIAAALQYVNNVNLAVKNENKGHVGYEALQDPNVTKVNTVYGVDYGKSKYDRGLLLNPSFLTIQNYRADELSAASKIINGVGKGVVLAGTTFLSGVGFWAYGVPTAIFSSRKDEKGNRLTAGQLWSKLWDNEFTRTLQLINDAAEKALPNYYTTYEQNNPLGHVFSANFLGDKLLKNVGFMIGAYYSGNVIGTLTKLSRLPALMANITGKLSTAKNVTAGIGAFSSAVGGGAIEALNNSRDWAEYQKIGIEKNYNKQFQDILNSAISQQEKEALIIQLNNQKQKELENLEKEKARMGNMNLLLNIPILTFSNVIQFARLYSGGYNTSRKLGHLIARNQGQQFANINVRSAAKAFGKTFISEGSEEFLQRVASSTSGNYYDDNIEQFRRSFIDPQANEDVANALTRFMRASAQAWSENIKDPTAIEEFLIGGISGMLGMPSFGRANTENAWLGKNKIVGLSEGIIGQFQKSKDEYLRANRYMEELNNMIQNGNIPTYFRGLSAHTFYDGKLQQNLEDENAFEYKNNELSLLVSQVITFDNAGKLSDLETMVNSALSDLTDLDLEAIYNETKKEDGTSVFDVNNESPLLTEEGKQSMRQKLENTRNKILNVIKDYRRISENLDIEFGESLSDEQLAELTWMQTTIADQTRRINSVYGDIKTPLLQFLNNTNILEKTKQLYIDMGLVRTIYKGNRTFPKGSTVTVNEDGTVKVVNSENKTESKFPKGTQYKTNEDGSISLTFEAQTKPNHNYTTEERFIVDFAKNEVAKAEELDALINRAKEILLKSPDEAAEYLSNNPGLLNLMHIINDLYNDDVTSKKDISTKLDDLTKLHKFRDAFKKRATDYSENPGKSAEEIEELKKKIQLEERDKKVELYKKDLKEAKTVKEFSKVFENIPSEFQKEVIDSLIKDGNTIAKSYQEMSEYRKDILTDLLTAAIDKSINTDYQKLIRSLAGYLFDEVIFSNSNSLDEISNPNRVNGIKVSSDLEIFRNMPEDQKNLVIQYAKYILQESIVAMNNKTAFKNRIKAEYKKPTTAVTSPITNKDNSGTTKIPTIDAPLLDNSKDVILDIISKSKAKNTLNIEKAKKQIEEFFEQLDKAKNSDDLKKLRNLISSITSSIHSLVSREQKSQIADMLFDNHETKEKEIMNSVARLLEDDVEVSVDEIHITNKEDHSDKLSPGEKGKPHEFYVPTLKEYNKGVREADVSNITFTEELKKHIQALYKYLIDLKAFEYVSLGKLKEGDKVYFIIDPTISQNSDYEGLKSDTIFLAVESGGKHQIIGSIQDLQGAISKFKGLQDLIDDITREYDSTSKDKKFVYSKTSTVNSNKIGSLLITENELTIKEIFNNTEDLYKKGILFGFMRDARIKIPGDPDIEIQDWIPDSKNKEGRMYMLLPTNKYVNGKRVYYPVAVRTKRFSREFYTEDLISRFKTALTDILNRSNGLALPESFFSSNDVIINRTIDNILGCIVDLTNAKNKSDVISALNKLSRYLYMYYQGAENNFDINFDYFQHSENADRLGKGISISRYPLRRDSNGLRLGRQKGDTLLLEARIYDNSNKTPQNRAEELLDAILQLNLQFSTRKQELQNLNESKNPSNYSLIRDELITSDIEKAQVVNAWFTIDYYDALSNEGKGGFVTASPTRNVGNQKTQPSKTNATNTAVFTHNNREYKLYTENGISVVMVDGTKLNSKLSYLISFLYVVQNQFTPNNEVVLNGVKYYKILYTQKGENKIGFVKSLDTIDNLQDIKDNEIKDIFISTLSNKDLHTTLLGLFDSKNNPAPVLEDKLESEEKTKKKKEEDRSKIPAINMVLNQTQPSVPVKYTTNKGNSGLIDAIVTSFEHDGMQVVVGLENNSKFYGVQLPEDDPESYVNSLVNSITAKDPIKFRVIITNDANSISYTSSFSNISTSVANFENIIKNAISDKIQKGDLKVNITTQEQPQTLGGADLALQDAFDELYKATTEEEYEVWDKEKELKWLRKNLPFLSEKTRLLFVDGLIPIMGTDRKAWGKFNKGIITLSNIAIKGTLYHEAFHSVFHTLLSDRDRADIMKEAREKYGNKTAILLEEELADAFMNYVIDQEDLSFGLKIIKFFKNLFIKVTHWKRSQDAINKLFEDIQSGKYKNIRPLNSDNTLYSEEQYTQEMQEIKNKAIADGTFMLAPNGNPTNLTERQWIHVRTKAFKEWFGDWINPNITTKVIIDAEIIDPNKNWIDGSDVIKENNKYYFVDDFKTKKEITKSQYDEFKSGKQVILSEQKRTIEVKNTNYSKVLDENGEPLIMYHRSNDNIIKFDINKSRHGGFWFSKNPDYYSDTKAKLPYSIPVFLNIRQPNIIEHGTFEGAIDGDVSLEGGLDSNRYDGWITKSIRNAEFYGDENEEHIVFAMAVDPNQIKSATDNIGSYSRDNDDIRYREVQNNKYFNINNKASELHLTELLKLEVYDNYVNMMDRKREGKAITREKFDFMYENLSVFKFNDTYIFGEWDPKNSLFRGRLLSAPNIRALYEGLDVLLGNVSFMASVPEDIGRMLEKKNMYKLQVDKPYNFRGEDMVKHLYFSSQLLAKKVFNKDINEITTEDVLKYDTFYNYRSMLYCFKHAYDSKNYQALFTLLKELGIYDKNAYIYINKFRNNDLTELDKMDIVSKIITYTKINQVSISNYDFINDPIIYSQLESEVSKILANYISKLGFKTQFNTDLSELGMDSLETVSLLNKIIYVNKNNLHEYPENAGYAIAFMMQYNPLITEIMNDMARHSLFKGNISKEDKLKAVGELIALELYNRTNENVPTTLIHKIKLLVRQFLDFLNNIKMSRVNRNIGYVVDNIILQNTALILQNPFKPGAYGDPVTQVSLEKALLSDSFGSDIVEVLSNYFILTGSVSLAELGTVFRPDENLLHDLDWASSFDSDTNKQIVLKEFPNSVYIRHISNDTTSDTDTWLFVPKGYTIENLVLEGDNNKVVSYDIVDSKGNTVNSYDGLTDSFSKKDVIGKAVDVFANSGRNFYSSKTLSGKPLKLSSWKDTMKAKLEYSRLKDIWDYNRFIPNENVNMDTLQLELAIENSNIEHINKTDFYSLKESLQTLLKSKGITPDIYNNMTKEELEYLRDCVGF